MLIAWPLHKHVPMSVGAQGGYVIGIPELVAATHMSSAYNTHFVECNLPRMNLVNMTNIIATRFLLFCIGVGYWVLHQIRPSSARLEFLIKDVQASMLAAGSQTPSSL